SHPTQAGLRYCPASDSLTIASQLAIALETSGGTAMITTAITASGQLRGQEEHGVVVFRGVPYATCDRFGPPRPVPAWEGEREATADGPIAPQWPSRLEPVMGTPEHHEQSEDCLSLTITTSGVDGVRPVLVWFHGGAWVSGAGNWKCYGGHRLAREGDVVV